MNQDIWGEMGEPRMNQDIGGDGIIIRRWENYYYYYYYYYYYLG